MSRSILVARTIPGLYCRSCCSILLVRLYLNLLRYFFSVGDIRESIFVATCLTCKGLGVSTVGFGFRAGVFCIAKLSLSELIGCVNGLSDEISKFVVFFSIDSLKKNVLHILTFESS